MTLKTGVTLSKHVRMNLEQITESVRFLRGKGITAPQIGIVLGTGLGNLVKEIKVELDIPYEQIPNFPLSTVESHSGKLLYGFLGGKKVLAMQGRFHAYEGYAMEEIVFPIRVLKQLGIELLLISNAAGAMNLKFNKGELMLITDHINKFPFNPLLGKNENDLGSRFPDMHEAYSIDLGNKLDAIAKREGVVLNRGVYISAEGPMLETPAEYRMLRILGGDAVGMSTIPEVIAARHMGLKCCAVSVLTDECDPENLKPVKIEDIIAVAAKAEKQLTKLFLSLIEEI